MTGVVSTNENSQLIQRGNTVLDTSNSYDESQRVTP